MTDSPRTPAESQIRAKFVMKKMGQFPLFVSLVVGIAALGLSGQSRESFSLWVDTNGNILLPEGFRTDWSHLGVWVVPEMGGLSFHEVYSERSSVEYFKEHQGWPDGATLVKEIRSSKSAKMTTGQASWASENKIWFVMVKDAKNRFPNNPIWGDGWGWALFKAEDPKVNVTKDYRRECISCHIPAKDDDWVYLAGYPTLKVASRDSLTTSVDRDAELPENVVSIKGLAFGPEDLWVKVGTTVTWINQDPFPHTATADDGSFDTDLIQPNQRASVTFEKAGIFPYYCTPHPFMKATIEVEE